MIDLVQLKEVEDPEIENIIKKQEEVGLQGTNDGRFRRSWWHFDFFGMLDGVEIYELDRGLPFQGVQTRHSGPRINGKLGVSNHPMLEHFKFLKAHARYAENVHPEPGDLAFPARAGRPPHQRICRPQGHLRRSCQCRQAILAFYDAGCRYLQFDDTAGAYL